MLFCSPCSRVVQNGRRNQPKEQTILFHQPHTMTMPAEIEDLSEKYKALRTISEEDKEGAESYKAEANRLFAGTLFAFVVAHSLG